MRLRKLYFDRADHSAGGEFTPTVAFGIALSINSLPKPFAFGSVVFGPPRSRQVTVKKRLAIPSLQAPVQINGAGRRENEPYLAALVASSWNTSPNGVASVSGQEHRLARDPDPVRIAADVRLELLVRQRREIGAPPVGVHQQRMGRGERGEAAIQAIGEFLVGFAEAPGLMRDRLHDRQRILDAVRQFAKQQFLLRVPRLAFGHVARALERELLPSDRLEDDAALDVSSRPSLVLCFSSPLQLPSSCNLDSQLGE